MDKHYIVCLDNIIQLEKSIMVDEKLINELDEQISNLAIPKQINKPIRKIVPRLQAQYKPVASFDIITWGIVTAVFVALFALIYIMAIAEGFFDFVFGVILAILPALATLAVCVCVEKIIYDVVGLIINAKRQKQAELEADQRYQSMLKENDDEYKYSVLKYNELLKFEEERLHKETKKKQEFLLLLEQTQDKKEASQKLLCEYYDILDIYPTYRNLIAICHICEYIKSGICTELTGPNGAFMVYKTEMYEKMKIERLDNIVSSLEQLHFDNQVLNKCLESMNQQVFFLTREIRDMREEQADAFDRMSQSLINLEDKGDELIRQNQISAYNQECMLNEIRYQEQLNYWRNR